MRTSLAGVWLALAALVPAVAQAHPQTGQTLGLVTGFLHPLSGLDHVMAMVAVGIWGAQLGWPAIWLLPVTFPVVMALGGFLGLIGVPLPGTEIGIALSALVLGVMVMTAARPALAVAALVVGTFAVFHGHAHGAEMTQGADAVLYSVGFVVATGLLHLVGIALGIVHRWRAGRVALRLVGAGIAGVSPVLLWSAVTG